MKRVAGSINLITKVDKHHLEQIFLKIKDKGLGEGGSLLDCGAGPGYRTSTLINYCDEYCSFEISEAMVNIFNGEKI